VGGNYIGGIEEFGKGGEFTAESGKFSRIGEEVIYRY